MRLCGDLLVLGLNNVHLNCVLEKLQRASRATHNIGEGTLGTSLAGWVRGQHDLDLEAQHTLAE